MHDLLLYLRITLSVELFLLITKVFSWNFNLLYFQTKSVMFEIYYYGLMLSFIVSIS